MQLHDSDLMEETMKHTLRILSLLSLCCSCLLLQPCEPKAEEGSKEDNVFQLGEIVVTGKAPAAEQVATVT